MHLYKYPFLLFVFLVAIGCSEGNKPKLADKLQTDTIIGDTVSIMSESAEEVDTVIAIDYTDVGLKSLWMYDCMEDTIVQLKQVNKDSITVDLLIGFLNEDFQNKVTLEYEKKSNDTLFVSIEDSHYLTQQMGSTGSAEYMIMATFTLTELSDIDFVNFSFVAGDHASPGIYSRKYFFDWIKRNKELNKVL